MAGAAQEKRAIKPATSSLAGLVFGLLSKGKTPQCTQGLAAAHGLVALAYIYVCVCVCVYIFIYICLRTPSYMLNQDIGAQWPVSWPVPPLPEKGGYGAICPAV